MTTTKKIPEGQTVERGDTVIFNVKGERLEYMVDENTFGIWGHLSIIGDNEKIFTLLGVDKNQFCKQAYGYEPRKGEWPFAKDYPALTRCINALYDKIEQTVSRPADDWEYSIPPNLTKQKFDTFTLQITNKPTIMQKLTSALKRILSPELQTQYKAGLRNGELELTERGRQELLEILAVEQADKLTAVAKEIIAEEEKSKE
jgi:hypothetical protein